MKAYLINTAEKTISEVNYSGDYTDIYKLCGYQTFDLVSFDKGDAVYVDDEGLLTDPPPTAFFGFLGYPQPLAGNGLILGSNSEGESTAPAYPIEWYKARLCWIERVNNILWSVRKNNSRAWSIMGLVDLQRMLEKPLVA